MKRTFRLFLCALLLIGCCTFAACGDDNGNGEENTSLRSLLGTWSWSDYDPEDDDLYTETFTFLANGRVEIEITSTQYPEDNGRGTVNYSVEGDLSTRALLTLWGSFDGVEDRLTYYATLRGDDLLLQEFWEDEIYEAQLFKRK